MSAHLNHLVFSSPYPAVCDQFNRTIYLKVSTRRRIGPNSCFILQYSARNVSVIHCTHISLFASAFVLGSDSTISREPLATHWLNRLINLYQHIISEPSSSYPNCQRPTNQSCIHTLLLFIAVNCDPAPHERVREASGRGPRQIWGALPSSRSPSPHEWRPPSHCVLLAGDRPP